MPRRGENIYKRKDGRWEGRYIRGHMNGKIMYGYVYAKTYKEVKDKLSVVPEPPVEKKFYIPIREPLSDVCFGKIASDWLEALKPQLKESSIVKYINVLTIYLFPRFKDSPIEAITRDEITDFSNELLVSGGQRGEGLSPKTVSCILSVMKNVFIYASQYEKLTVVDVNKFSFKQSQKPMRILSLAEQQKLSRYLCEELTLINLGILVCLYTGIRIGEMCALKWGDISFKEQYVHVHRTMQRIQNKGDEDQKTSVMITDPKSDCSNRIIPLPGDIFQLLVEAKCPENTYFLTGSAQTYVEPRTLQNRFKTAIKLCDIKDANFHALRHTFATRCVELGFDVKSLSEILGHASVNITMNRYVHPSMELKQRNMNMLSDLFGVK